MNDPIIRLLFLAHLGSSLYMVGLIWFVQVVHYPLFARVGNLEFPSYEQHHTVLTTWVVAPPMLIEGATAVLLIWFRPIGLPEWSVWSGLALLGVSWLSTACIQVPCHEFLSKVFDPVVHQRLVSTNWLRTVAWSLHGGLVLWMAWISLSVGISSPEHLDSDKMPRIRVDDRGAGMLTPGRTISSMTSEIGFNCEQFLRRKVWPQYNGACRKEQFTLIGSSA